MSKDWEAGLTDQDEMGQFPSAASPLSAMGIDPDMVRANPEILSRLGTEKFEDNQRKTPSGPAAVSMPSGEESKPAPSAPPAPTPSSDATPPDAHSYALQGLGLINKNLQSATDETGKMSTEAPVDVARLTAQQEKLSTPTQLYDPQTGKMVDQYKPTTGQKIWRGVRGGLVGLLTGGIPGAAVGALEPQDIKGGTPYSAPNKLYGRTEQRRQQELGATDEQLKTALQTWKDVNEAKGKKSSELRAIAGLGKDEVSGATGLINAENKPETEENKSKAKLELTQKEFDQRKQELATDPQLSKLSPLNKALYLANGKIPDPREPNEAEINAAQIARAMTVFKLQHGGKMPQTLEEFNSVVSAAKGDLGKGAGNKEDVIRAQNLRAAAKSAESYLKTLQGLMKHTYIPEDKKELQAKIDEAQTHYDDLQEQLTEAKDTSAPAAPPAAPPASLGIGTPQARPVGGAGSMMESVAPGQPAAPVAAAAPATKPQPAPDGTRRQAPNGTIEVKRNGKWEKE